MGAGIVAHAQVASMFPELKTKLTTEDKTKMSLTLLAQYNSDQFEYLNGRLSKIEQIIKGSCGN